MDLHLKPPGFYGWIGFRNVQRFSRAHRLDYGYSSNFASVCSGAREAVTSGFGLNSQICELPVRKVFLALGIVPVRPSPQQHQVILLQVSGNVFPARPVFAHPFMVFEPCIDACSQPVPWLF